MAGLDEGAAAFVGEDFAKPASETDGIAGAHAQLLGVVLGEARALIGDEEQGTAQGAAHLGFDRDAPAWHRLESEAGRI